MVYYNQVACPGCQQPMSRLRRNLAMRLIPGSMLFGCRHCARRYLQVFGRLRPLQERYSGYGG